MNIQNLNFRFPGRRLLLENVSFEVNKGELVALLGESGQGKSTVIQLLQKFYIPESGSMLIDKYPLSDISTKHWRSLVAVVPQQTKIFNMTLIENICLGNIKTEAEKVLELCERYNFDRYFKEFPQGYMTVLGEDGINISGGQRQLIAIARAIYRRPQLLLLDEATAALDKRTENFIINLLLSLKKDMGILIVTHRIRTASRANRIYILEKGTINDFGTHTQLMEGANLYSESFQELILDR